MEEPKKYEPEMPIIKNRLRGLIKDSFLRRKVTFFHFRQLLGICLGEMFGVAIFVFIGCSAELNPDSQKSFINVVLAFSFGISIAVFCVFYVSGSVLNPALNWTVMIMGHISVFKLMLYTVFQTLGGILGVGLNYVLWKNIPENFCMAIPDEGVSLWQHLMGEIVFTFLLGFVLCGLIDGRHFPKSADTIGIKFGLTIAALAIPCVKFGASMNPARAFGPALLAGNLKNVWVNWIGPITGAILIGLVYAILLDQGVDRNIEEDSPGALNRRDQV